LWPPPDPAGEVIRSLRCWPDAELLSLVKAAARELIRRRLPLPAAVPVVQAAYAALHENAPAIADALGPA
jgi:hypothetical protein